MENFPFYDYKRSEAVFASTLDRSVPQMQIKCTREEWPELHSNFISARLGRSVTLDRMTVMNRLLDSGQSCATRFVAVPNATCASVDR